MVVLMDHLPIVTKMTVVPVAGYDSLLLNLSGGHGPVFIRNLVVLEDNAGHTGVGETPGGEIIRTTLEKCIELVVGRRIGQVNDVLQKVHERYGTLDAGGPECKRSTSGLRSMCSPPSSRLSST